MKKRDVFLVGMHFLRHYRQRLEEVGLEVVARQLRKQGHPPEIAALILAPQAVESNPQPTERHVL